MDPTTFLISSIVLINYAKTVAQQQDKVFYIPFVVAAPIGFICPIVWTASLQKEKSNQHEKLSFQIQ